LEAAAARRRSVHRPRRTGQIKSRGQRAHGFDVGPPAFPAFQRAHGMNRESGNRRELLLREARSLAERFEVRAK
jgi:hypothetical protein